MASDMSAALTSAVLTAGVSDMRGYEGAADPYFNNVVYLVNGHDEGRDGSIVLRDLSLVRNPLTRVGEAGIKPASNETYKSAIYCDGVGDYITSPYNAALDLPGDFTIEFSQWTPQTAGNNFFMTRRDLAGVTNLTSWGLLLDTGANRGLMMVIGGGTFKTFTFASGNATPVKQWVDFAVVRSAGVVTAYRNGEKSTLSFADSSNYTDSWTFALGQWDNVPNVLTGYLRKIRITKGIARYTASYTPSTFDFPTA